MKQDAIHTWFKFRDLHRTAHCGARGSVAERRVVGMAALVEVDGGQHADSAADAKRDAAMRGLGYKTIRVWNNDVLGNIEGVLEMLRA